MDISGKTAIVTGGASGLGGACVRTIVAKGGNAVIMDIDEKKGDQLAAELGDKAICVKADVMSEESVISAVKQATDTFGGIHIAINCAGGGPPTKVLSRKGVYPIDVFNRTIQLNLIGTFNVLRLAVEQMDKNEPDQNGEKGVVINTASAAAFDGQIGQAAYSAAKAAIVGMALPIARECASYGVRIMTIAPGIFDTPLLASLSEPVRDSLGKMVPFPSRLGHPDEFASMAREIIENPYLNGEVIRLDGAIRMAAK